VKEEAILSVKTNVIVPVLSSLYAFVTMVRKVRRVRAFFPQDINILSQKKYMYRLLIIYFIPFSILIAVEAFYQDAQRGMQRNNIDDIIKNKSSVGDFSNKFVSGMNGRVPGNYHFSRPRVGSAKSLYKNCYNDRAKEGFVYWYMVRPKPTLCK
jgi:hypothetical protein